MKEWAVSNEIHSSWEGSVFTGPGCQRAVGDLCVFSRVLVAGSEGPMHCYINWRDCFEKQFRYINKDI